MTARELIYELMDMDLGKDVTLMCPDNNLGLASHASFTIHHTDNNVIIFHDWRLEDPDYKIERNKK